MVGNAQGSRRVCDMDLERVYRKRAIDRENQRNLRRKNKGRILELEAELSAVCQRLKESENTVMVLTQQSNATSHAIDSIVNTLQTLQRSISPTEPASTGETAPMDKYSQSATSILDDPASTFSIETDLDSQSWLNGGTVSFPFEGSVSDLADFTFDLSSLANGSPSSAEQLSYFGHAQNPRPATIPTTCEGEFHSARLEANSYRGTASVWSMTPQFSRPTCKVDRLLCDLIEAQKQEHLVHSESVEFAHGSFPSVNSLLNPSLTESDKPVASTIAKHVAGVVRVESLPGKLALLYVMCLLMRWQVIPTEKNYNAIPEFARPTLLQTVIPHPPWVATIGWPAARDQIIRHMDFTEYPKFASIIIRSFSINWPYEITQMLDASSGQDYVLSDQFVRHIRDIRNWTVAKDLTEAFPFLEGAVNIL